MGQGGFHHLHCHLGYLLGIRHGTEEPLRFSYAKPSWHPINPYILSDSVCTDTRLPSWASTYIMYSTYF